MRKMCVITAFLWVCLSVMAQPQIVFTPQWTAHAQFAGFYVAKAKGFYKEAGLNVLIEHSSPSNPCINRLENGSSQIITLQLLSAMRYINEGIPLINVMQILQTNSQMIVSQKPIKSVQDLKGKRIGCWKVGFSEQAYLLDRQYHLDIEWIPFFQHVNLFLSKAIDATMAQSYNEFFQLQLAGLRFQNNQLLYLADIGLNIPEDGIYVTAEYYRLHKKEVDAFVAATRKGWEWAVKHEQETLDIVMEAIRNYGVHTNIVCQRWMLRKILELTKDKESGFRTYRLSSEALDLANRLMYDNGFIKQKISYQQITRP